MVLHKLCNLDMAVRFCLRAPSIYYIIQRRFYIMILALIAAICLIGGLFVKWRLLLVSLAVAIAGIFYNVDEDEDGPFTIIAIVIACISATAALLCALFGLGSIFGIN